MPSPAIPVLTPSLHPHPGDNPNKPMNPLITGVFGAIAGAIVSSGNLAGRDQDPDAGGAGPWRGRQGPGEAGPGAGPISRLLAGVLQGLEAHKYRNTWDCGLQILRNEGLKA